MDLISRNASVLYLQCVKLEDYKSMLEVIDIDWFLKLNSKNQRKFLQDVKKGRFRIVTSIAKKQGLYFEESEKEIILSDSDIEVLGYLENEKGYSTRELGKKYNRPTSTLASKIGRLVSYGYVKRNKKTTNGGRGRTRVDYTLTDKGVDYWNELCGN